VLPAKQNLQPEKDCACNPAVTLLVSYTSHHSPGLLDLLSNTLRPVCVLPEKQGSLQGFWILLAAFVC
jgi:hypothetical protein